MTTYNIGYINKPWSNNDFVILAQSHNKNVAKCIRDSYNEAYKQNGLSAQLTILTDAELPQEFRFSMDD